MTASANTVSPDPTVPTPEPRIMTIRDYKRLAAIDDSRLANIDDLYMVVVGISTMDVDGRLRSPKEIGQSSCWDGLDSPGLRKTLDYAEKMFGINDDYVVW